MKTREIGELITIAEVINETIESSNLNTEELAFVMNQVCNKIHPSWVQMPFYMIAGAMDASNAEKCIIKFTKENTINCSFVAAKNQSLNLKKENNYGITDSISRRMGRQR